MNKDVENVYCGVSGRPVPLWRKTTLSIDEAAALSGIGANRIREMAAKPGCGFSLAVGAHTRIKREKFEEYLNKATFV